MMVHWSTIGCSFVKELVHFLNMYLFCLDSQEFDNFEIVQ